jgi:hypothetical protein
MRPTAANPGELALEDFSAAAKCRTVRSSQNGDDLEYVPPRSKGPANSEAFFKTGGDEGDRTPDLMNAIHALSQLSYIPGELCFRFRASCLMWVSEEILMTRHAIFNLKPET